MHKNKAETHSTRYIIQVQHGPLAFSGTWFSPYEEYELALDEFLDIISCDKGIAIQNDDGMGMYIEIGPGMVVMFMTEDMAEKIRLRQQFTAR